MSVFHFILGCLATYRLTVLIARDACPWDACKRLRKVARFTKALSCPFCVSVWVGALVAAAFYFSGVIETGVVWVCIALSFSAVTIAIDRTFTADYQT